jgi:hypothetical protein
VLERSVRRGELSGTEAAADLQAVLIGAVLMLVMFNPEMDEGLLRNNKIVDLATAVLHGVVPVRRAPAADHRGSAKPAHQPRVAPGGGRRGSDAGRTVPSAFLQRSSVCSHAVIWRWLSAAAVAIQPSRALG